MRFLAAFLLLSALAIAPGGVQTARAQTSGGQSGQVMGKARKNKVKPHKTKRKVKSQARSR